jgi:hypothetical protein
MKKLKHIKLFEEVSMGSIPSIEDEITFKELENAIYDDLSVVLLVLLV